MKNSALGGWKPFHDASIKRKLMLIGLFTMLVAVLSISVAQTVLHWREGREHAADELLNDAQLISMDAAHELSAGNTRAVGETLSALKSRPDIGYAAVYDTAGRLIAAYRSAGSAAIPRQQLPLPEAYRFTVSGLVVATRMRCNDQECGIFYLQADLRTLYRRLVRDNVAIILVALASFSIPIILFARLQRAIVNPIRELADAMTIVSARRDYTMRVRKTTRDEIGTLVDGFNEMLATIEARDAELAQHRLRLEEEVAQRTTELSAARDFLDGVANTSAGVIFAIAPDGRFEFMNEQGAAIVGYSREELLQQPFLMLFSPEQHPTLMGNFAAMLGGASVYGQEHAVTRKDGEIRWIEYSAAPVKVGGKVIRVVGTASDITERKQITLALEASEFRLRAVLDAATDGIVVADAQTHRIALANPGICAMLGYTPEEMTALGVEDIHPADALPYVLGQFERQRRGEIKLATDMPVQRKDGSVFFADISSSPMKLEERMFLVGMFHDITERRRVEMQLRLFRTLVDNAPDEFVVVDPVTLKVLDANERACLMLGYSREELLTMSVPDFDPAYDSAAHQKALSAAEESQLAVFESIHRRKDGSTFPVEVTVRMIELDRPYAISVARDITERIRSRREREFKNIVLSTQQETSPDGILVVDAQANILYYNQRFIALWNIPAELVAAGDDEPVLQHVVGRQADPTAFLARVRYLYEHREEKSHDELSIEDGRTVDRYSAPMLGADGTYYGRVWYFRDITERKRNEAQLRLFRTLVDNAPDALEVYEPETQRVLDINETACLALGYSREELLGMNVTDFDPAITAESLQRAYEEMARSGLAIFESVHKRKDGSTFPVEVIIRLVRLDKTYLIAVARDITERKRNDAIIQASLAEKEALLREIHHRVKNNMQVVISLLNLEASRIADPAVVQMLRDGQRRIEVMALVHEKLHQSRDLAQVDAKAYIEDLARSTFHAHVRGGAKVRLVLDVEPVGLGLDAATPCGLIVNELISNALKYAFPGDGAGEIRVALHAADDGDIELAVSDDGSGMPVEFDWRGAQTLGLRLVRNLVERQLQGQLELDRAHGTEWRIRFGS